MQHDSFVKRLTEPMRCTSAGPLQIRPGTCAAPMVHSLVAAALLAAASCASPGGSVDGLRLRVGRVGLDAPRGARAVAARIGWRQAAIGRVRFDDVALAVGLLLRRQFGMLRARTGSVLPNRLRCALSVSSFAASSRRSRVFFARRQNVFFEPGDNRSYTFQILSYRGSDLC